MKMKTTANQTSGTDQRHDDSGAGASEAKLTNSTIISASTKERVNSPTAVPRSLWADRRFVSILYADWRLGAQPRRSRERDSCQR